MKAITSKTKQAARAKAKEWRPEVGSKYWCVCTAKQTIYADWFLYEESKNDEALFAAGLACRTKAQALRKARAMLRAAKEAK